MFEANNIVVNCPSCNTPLPVLLIQIATQQVIVCDHCKKEFRLLDKDARRKGRLQSHILPGTLSSKVIVKRDE